MNMFSRRRIGSQESLSLEPLGSHRAQHQRRNSSLASSGNEELGNGSGSEDEQHFRQSQQRPRVSPLRPRLRLLLRFLGLFLFPQLTKWRLKKEPKKIAVQSGRSAILLQSVIHLPGLLGAITIFLLNSQERFVSYKQTGRVWLPFAAKLHEIFMQASLATILFTWVNTRARNEFVPFGWLLAPTYTSRISYLWSLEFWSTATAGNESRAFGAGIFTMGILILASLCGPSSTVAMIPRPFIQNRGSKFNISLGHTPSVEFPKYINEDQLISQFAVPYLEDLGNLYPFGPDGFFRTYSLPESITQRFLEYGISDVANTYPVASANTPTLGMSSRLINMYTDLKFDQDVQDNKGDVSITTFAFQPEVEVRCAQHNWRDHPGNTSVVQVPMDSTSAVDVSRFSDVVDGFDHKTGQFGSFWTKASSDLPYSVIAMFFGISSNQSDMTLSKMVQQSGWDNTELNILACGVSAAWARAQYQVIPGCGRFLTATSSAGAYDRVLTTIDPIWCHKVEEKLINWPHPLEDLTHFDWSVVRTLQTESNGVEISSPMELVLSAMFAHAMSQIDVAQVLNYTKEHCPGLPGFESWPHCDEFFDSQETCCNSVNATIEATVFGYSDSKTQAFLSLIVLFIYCFVVVAFLLFRIVFKLSSSSAWDSPIELISLALLSDKPTHLHNISVGIDTTETLRQYVGIRVNEDGKIEFVFVDDPRTKHRTLTHLEKDKEY